MENNKFTYTYSAAENKEIREIRKKYLPEENKLEEMRRLDRKVQSAGMAESLAAGCFGSLLFGGGLCIALKWAGPLLLLSIPLCIMGAAAVLAAYPLHSRAVLRAKEKYSSRILQLADELSEKNHKIV